LALLEGDKMTIEPEGFSDTHSRGGSEHRLRSGEIAKKWQPLGVGALEQELDKLPEPSSD
jgi:hypothetical protein